MSCRRGPGMMLGADTDPFSLLYRWQSQEKPELQIGHRKSKNNRPTDWRSRDC